MQAPYPLLCRFLKKQDVYKRQVILSAPPDKIGDISTLVDRNLCVMRKGHTTIVRAFDPREAAYVES